MQILNDKKVSGFLSSKPQTNFIKIKPFGFFFFEGGGVVMG